MKTVHSFKVCIEELPFVADHQITADVKYEPFIEKLVSH
jgi:hypothetical protein